MISNKSFLIKLSKHTDVLKFLASLTSDEFEFLKNVASMSPVAFAQLNKLKNSDVHVQTLYKIWDYIDNKDEFIKNYTNLITGSYSSDFNIIDAFSKGQLDSKNWLVTQLKQLNLELGTVWILCGWVGTLAYLIKHSDTKLNYNYIRSFDIDSRCTPLAEIFNKAELINNWKFKASTLDVNTLNYSNHKFPTIKSNGDVQYIQESADTVINTSCDHMNSNIWWDRIPAGTLVILQNNNFVEKDEHVNIVTSLNEFKDRYPMNTILYEGELDCTLYTRYMLIGRK
jgi:hypothetical protein